MLYSLGTHLSCCFKKARVDTPFPQSTDEPQSLHTYMGTPVVSILPGWEDQMEWSMYFSLSDCLIGARYLRLFSLALWVYQFFYSLINIVCYQLKNYSKIVGIKLSWRVIPAAPSSLPPLFLPYSPLLSSSSVGERERDQGRGEENTGIKETP